MPEIKGYTEDGWSFLRDDHNNIKVESPITEHKSNGVRVTIADASWDRIVAALANPRSFSVMMDTASGHNAVSVTATIDAEGVLFMFCCACGTTWSGRGT